MSLKVTPERLVQMLVYVQKQQEKYLNDQLSKENQSGVRKAKWRDQKRAVGKLAGRPFLACFGCLFCAYFTTGAYLGSVLLFLNVSCRDRANEINHVDLQSFVVAWRRGVAFLAFLVPLKLSCHEVCSPSALSLLSRCHI